MKVQLYRGKILTLSNLLLSDIYDATKRPKKSTNHVSPITFVSLTIFKMRILI